MTFILKCRLLAVSSPHISCPSSAILTPPYGSPCATAVKPTLKREGQKTRTWIPLAPCFCNSETLFLYRFFLPTSTFPGQPISSSNRQDGKQTVATLIFTHQPKDKHSDYGNMPDFVWTIADGVCTVLSCYYRVIYVSPSKEPVPPSQWRRKRFSCQCCLCILANAMADTCPF